jgi:hypothetical protein
MRRLSLTLILGLLLSGQIWPQTAKADDKSYICSINEARACTALDTCKDASLQDLYIAPLVVLDLENKQIVSAAMDDRGRKDPINGFNRFENELIIYGHANDEAWSAVVSLESGALTANITTSGTAYVLFGYCAPNVNPG